MSVLPMDFATDRTMISLAVLDPVTARGLAPLADRITIYTAVRPEASS